MQKFHTIFNVLRSEILKYYVEVQGHEMLCLNGANFRSNDTNL